MVTRTAGSVFSRQQRCLSETFHLHSYWSATSDLFVYFHFHLMNSGQRLFHQWLAFSSGGDRTNGTFEVLPTRDNGGGAENAKSANMWMKHLEMWRVRQKRWDKKGEIRKAHQESGDWTIAGIIVNTKQQEKWKNQQKFKENQQKWKLKGKGKNPYYRCSSQTSLCQLFLFVDH